MAGTLLFKLIIEQLLLLANIESSPVWDTSCPADQIYDLINRQFLCGKCPKPVTIQYLPAVVVVNMPTVGITNFFSRPY